MKPISAFGIVIGFLSISAILVQATLATPATVFSTQATQAYAPKIDPGNFVTTIDNPYFPLTPGTTKIFEGKTDAGLEHEQMQVTSTTKVIMGVTCVTVTDTVTLAGKLEEVTTDWYAQDKQGNVWYFGEDSKAYKNGKVVSTKGSWLAGINGAYPGYVMKANPTPNETYRQEYQKGEAEDWATIISLNESATVPQGSYKNVRMTKEWSALDNPPAYEYKYYAKDIGQIMTASGTSKNSWKISLLEIQSK
jgi:hypothetical protein